MNQYLLLLHNDPKVFQSEDMSPQRLQEILGKYKAWRARLTEAGHIAGGNKLENGTGKVMRADTAQSKVRITDGPYAESKEVIGGYFMVNAESYEDAVELSRDCPHLEFGAIEVRRVEKV
jgi:hypothetical protein